MLMKLSFRNVKRQFDEYTLFFVTLTSTVASMYTPLQQMVFFQNHSAKQMIMEMVQIM